MRYAAGTNNPPSIGMVNDAAINPHDALRALALSYAPVEARQGTVALFALDSALGNVLRTTREPMVGRMRLAWWRDALERLDVAPPPAEPVLEALAACVTGRPGVSGARLARLPLAWEWLLEAPLDLAALRMHAALRGEMFDVAAALCGHAADRSSNIAGRGWAFADVARNLKDADLAHRARTMADLRLALSGRIVWPRRLRALGALSLIARMNQVKRQSAGMVARLAWHRLTGR